MNAQALDTQLRVIHALALRELRTRFGRARLGYVWAVLEPLIYVATFALLLSFRSRILPSGVPVFLFLVTGFVPFFLYRNTVIRSMTAVASNRALLTFPQVQHIDLVLAKSILEYVTMSVVAIILVVLIAQLGYDVQMEDPLGVVWWFSMFSFAGLGFGLIVSAIAPLFATVERVASTLMMRILFFTSGLFFTADMLPTEARELVLLNPLLHCTELLRSAFFLSFESKYADEQFVYAVVVIQLALGLLLVKALKKQILIAAQNP